MAIALRDSLGVCADVPGGGVLRDSPPLGILRRAELLITLDPVTGIARDPTGRYAVQSGSAPGLDSGDPTPLPPVGGKPYAWLPGGSGNGLVGAAGIPLTNGFECEVEIEPLAWSNNFTFVNQRGAANLWRIYNNGVNIVLQVYDAAGTAVLQPSASNAALVGRQRFRLRAAPAAGTASIERRVNGEWQVMSQLSVAPFVMHAAAVPVTLGASSTALLAELFAGAYYECVLRDGNGNVLLSADFTDAAKYNAALTQFAPAIGPAFNINRSASGKKAAVPLRTIGGVHVPAAVSVFGFDDYLEVADAAGLDFAATDRFTLLIAMRRYGTAATQALVAKKLSNNANDAGYVLRSSSTGNEWVSQVSDAAVQLTAVGTVFADGQCRVLAQRFTGPDALLNYKDGALDVGSSVPGVVAAAIGNALGLRIGRMAGLGTAYGDYELFGFALFREALSAAEIAAAGALLLTS